MSGRRHINWQIRVAEFTIAVTRAQPGKIKPRLLVFELSRHHVEKATKDVAGNVSNIVVEIIA
jgi:hypothetical protein